MRHFISLILALAFGGSFAYAESFEFNITARLTEPNGKPLEGPLAIQVSFFHQEAGGSPVLSVTEGLESVVLQEGVLQADVKIGATDYARVFSSVEQSVYVEITNLSAAEAGPFPRVRVGMMPFAAKIPVSSKELRFDEAGRLGFSAKPEAGKFLKATEDGLVWESLPSNSAPIISGSYETGKLVSADGAGGLTWISPAALPISEVGGVAAMSIAAGATLANEASSAVGANTLVKRDASGGFAVSTLAAQNLGIGTSSPQVPLHVVSTVTVDAPSYLFEQTNNFNQASYDTYSSVAAVHSGQVLFRRARGTPTAPEAVMAGDQVGAVQFRGHDGNSFEMRASVAGYVEGPVSDASVPTGIRLSTGTTEMNERMRIDASGKVGIGTTSPTAHLTVVDQGTQENAVAVAKTISITAPNAAASHRGLISELSKNVASGVTNSGFGLGLAGVTKLEGAGTLSQAVGTGGYSGTFDSAETGNIVSAYGVLGQVQHSGSGTITVAAGLVGTVKQLGGSYGPITDGYGLLIADVNATNDFGVYQSGADDTNYFAGNVGIGTTSPSAKLEILGNDADLMLSASTTTTTTLGNKDARIVLKNNSSTVNAGGEIILGAATDTDVDRYAAIGADIKVNSANGSFGDLYFATKALDTDTALTRRMVIQADGNVGIGTTAPGARLDLGTQAPGVQTPVSYWRANSANSNWPLWAGSIYDADWTDQHLMFNGVMDGGTRVAPTASSWGGGFFLRDTQNIAVGKRFDLGFFAAGTGQAMSPLVTVLNGGNVGIGTVTPKAHLHVQGGALCVSNGIGNDDCASEANAPGTIYAENTAVQGADYAEYFQSEEELVAGDVVGLNPVSGLARLYQRGDRLLGVVSTSPGVIGNMAIKKERSVLVALLGQVPFHADQVKIDGDLVKTHDGIWIGYLLASGHVHLRMTGDEMLARLEEDNEKLEAEVKRLRGDYDAVKDFLCRQDLQASFCSR